jgi:hypothetical protein
VTCPALPHIYGFEPAAERAPRAPETLRLRRAIVDHLGFPATCRRPGCRAAGACRSREVACFDTRRAFVMEALAAFAEEGYVADDG